MTGTSTSAIVPPRPDQSLHTRTMGEHRREPFRSWAAERTEAACFDISLVDATHLVTHGGIGYLIIVTEVRILSSVCKHIQ
jgi:hypothetical protein